MVSNEEKILLIEQALDAGDNLYRMLEKPLDQAVKMHDFVKKADLEPEEYEEVAEILSKLQETSMELDLVLEHLESKTEDLENKL